MSPLRCECGDSECATCGTEQGTRSSVHRRPGQNSEMNMTPEDLATPCFWHRWGGGEPCSATAVGTMLKKLDNVTDTFMWCAEHGGVRASEAEQCKKEEKP